MKFLHKKNYIDAAALAADSNGETIDLSNLKGISAHVIWTSTTASFTVKLQLSNDDGLNWVDHTTSQAILNNNGTAMINYPDLHAKAARVVVVRTSGTLTTVKVHVSGKDA